VWAAYSIFYKEQWFVKLYAAPFCLPYRMPAQPWQELTFKNAHPRDAHMTFDEPTHIYTIKGSSKGVISCTGFLHEFFSHFDAEAVIANILV
jgi:hypothetical protein